MGRINKVGIGDRLWGVYPSSAFQAHSAWPSSVVTGYVQWVLAMVSATDGDGEFARVSEQFLNGTSALFSAIYDNSSVATLSDC